MTDASASQRPGRKAAGTLPFRFAADWQPTARARAACEELCLQTTWLRAGLLYSLVDG